MSFERAEITLFIAGWAATVCSAITGSFIVLDIGLLALGLTGVMRIAMLVLDRNRSWSVCAIFAGGLMPSYFIGAFVTLVQYDPNSPYFTLPLGDDFITTAPLVILDISLFYWVLIGLAKIETRWWQKTLAVLNTAEAWKKDEAIRPAIAFALTVVTALQMFLFLTGQVTLNGLDASEDSHLPMGIIIIMNLADAVLGISAWIIGRWRKPWGLVAMAVVTSAWQIVWLGGMGRRTLLYGAVLFFSVFIWARGGRINRRFFYLAVPTLGVVYFFTKLFIAMRYANYAYASAGTQQSLVTLYSDAFSLISTDADTVAELEKENYSSRFFIFGYLSLTIHGLALPMAQFGKFLFIAMFSSIPSALFPDKVDIMMKNGWFGDGKGLLNDILSLEQVDFAWTPVVTSYADFMWLGPFLYPLFMLLLGWIFTRLVQSIRSPTLIIGCLGTCLMEFLGTEEGMSVYILAGRTLAFIWLFAKIVEYFGRPAISK